MRNCFLPLFLLLILFISVAKSFALSNYDYLLSDETVRISILIPTGNIVNDLPEMEILSDTTLLHQGVLSTINNSVITRFLDFFFIVQVYLKNSNKFDTIEPAYLALSQNEGGFAKTGFTIKHNDAHTEKRFSPYIDITLSSATADPARLMSLTQLFPHELGHVILGLLSEMDTVKCNRMSSDIHFFSVVTDFATAFDEGFAIHCENIARLFESNETIKTGIFSDIEKIGKYSSRSIEGYTRDLYFFFRLGYYRATKLLWYSKYENYRRYQQSINADIRYKNASIRVPFLNLSDRLSYRNSGVRLDETQNRSIIQLHSTEGVISAYFTRLSTSELANNYLEQSFYQPFLPEYFFDSMCPRELFTPIQNQFIKYFYVFHNYVVSNNSSNSQLIDFIDGYVSAFPEEEIRVKKIYKQTFGLEYTGHIPPSLWILVNDFEHRPLLYDLFNSHTRPFYTFNLNAAEFEDLLTISGITAKDAKRIIDYRDTVGFFGELKDLHKIPGLSSEVIEKIISQAFDKEDFEYFSGKYPFDLNITSLIINPLKHLAFVAFIWYLFIFGTMLLVMKKFGELRLSGIIIQFIKYFVVWLLFTIIGLVSVVISSTAPLITVCLVILTVILMVIIFQRNREKKKRTLVFVAVMGLSVLVSVL